MVDARHAHLAIIALGSLAAFFLVMDACRRVTERGALEWRRGRLLSQAQHPGPFRLGLLLMRGAGMGFAFGAARAVTALFGVLP